MKYIYLILLTFFVACKEEEKPQDKKEEEQVLPVKLLSDDEVKEIETLSKDDDGNDRKFQDLSKDEQNKVKLLVNDLIDKNKDSLNKMLTLMNKEAAEKGEKTNSLKEFIKEIKDDFIEDENNPKEKIIEFLFITAMYSMSEHLSNTKKDLKAKMQILSETKDYAKINNVLNLGLNQTELDSIKETYWTLVIYLNSKEVDFKEFIEFKLLKNIMIELLDKLKLPQTSKLYAKVRTKDEADKITVTDEGLFKGMTLEDLFRLHDKLF